jgi:TonB family protein
MKTYQLYPKTVLALVIAGMYLASTVQAARSQESQSEPPKVIRKSGGVLQGAAIRRVQPVYPPLAKAAQVSGGVVVEVTTDEDGKVVMARAISGHPLLKDAAVAAAREWKFSETKLEGRPVKVVGTITFNFSLDTSKEIEALKAEIAASPESAEARLKLGNAYMDTNSVANAAEAFKQAVRIKPDYAEAYLKLGEAYCKLHRSQSLGDHTSEEMEAFEQAIRLAPDSAEAYFGLANAHIYFRPLKTEENLRAAGLLKYAIKLKPDYQDAYLVLSDVYMQLDLKDEAIDTLKQYARLYPRQGNPPLAGLYVRLGRFEDAVETYKEIVSDQPANPYARFELGSAYVALGNKELAMKEYEALRSLNQELAESLLKAINK